MILFSFFSNAKLMAYVVEYSYWHSVGHSFELCPDQQLLGTNPGLDVHKSWAQSSKRSILAFVVHHGFHSFIGKLGWVQSFFCVVTFLSV